jgi:hypothetical protein
MPTEILRDGHGNKIGSVETTSNGRQILRDKHGSKLGEYDPRSNVTRDRHGNKSAPATSLPPVELKV